MLKVRGVLMVALIAGLVADTHAQKKPDFSGVWAPAAVKTNAPERSGGVSALPPSDLTIQHTAVTFATSITAFDIVNTQTYRLDDSESTNKSGAVTRLTHSRWDGPRLIIEGKMSQVTSAGYAAWTLKETYSLNARGQLILEGEYKGSDGKDTSSTREFTKKPSK